MYQPHNKNNIIIFPAWIKGLLLYNHIAKWIKYCDMLAQVKYWIYVQGQHLGENEGSVS